MSRILTKEELDECLRKYYEERFGEEEPEEWFEQPALNVRCFKQNGKYISLKAHILTGEVEEFVE